MFSRIRPQPTLLRCTQNALYSIITRAQTATATTAVGWHVVRQNHNDAHKPHTPDSYSKDVDRSPPGDAKVHRVDPNSDVVQKPYEAPSGWSRAGVKADEYRSAEPPYPAKKGETIRNGAVKGLGSTQVSRDE